MIGLRSLLLDDSRRQGLVDIALRLESGEPSAKIVLECGTLDVVAAVALAGLAPETPPLVQAAPRRPLLKSSASEPALALLFPRSSRVSRLTLAAGLLQILDFWDDSHLAAQEADDLAGSPHSAYWHAIAHRREPDPGNAAYWFRRVGRLPSFETFEQAIPTLLDAAGQPDLAHRLRKNFSWDPLAFVDLCGEAARQPGTPAEAACRQIQVAEMLWLLEATVSLVDF